MKNLFPYGNWVWVTVSQQVEDIGVSYPHNGSFIIARTKEEALEILKKDLEMELSTSFNYWNPNTLVGEYNGVSMYYYVEPLNCLNPEVCGN